MHFTFHLPVYSSNDMNGTRIRMRTKKLMNKNKETLLQRQQTTKQMAGKDKTARAWVRFVHIKPVIRCTIMFFVCHSEKKGTVTCHTFYILVLNLLLLNSTRILVRRGSWMSTTSGRQRASKGAQPPFQQVHSNKNASAQQQILGYILYRVWAWNIFIYT